jgi:hypothetical protein
VLRIAFRLFGMGAYEALDFGRVVEEPGVTWAISAHFGIATMAMSLPAQRGPESFSRRMRRWLSTLSPRQEGTNSEETG